ncbi:MAG: TonB-dependent receptor plug [Gemmatimonadetes bacterium]|nr:TonB-dependent receptor plug [Gemmatimonadota bacterium]
MRRLASLAFSLATAATLFTPVGAQVIHRIGKPVADTTPPARPTQTPRRPVAAEGHATLSGVVYDSLHDVPVRGATVIVAGSTHQAVTDSNGVYRFDVDSLPEGVATVGFFMPGMDSLGITPPARQVGIHHGESALLDLAVPSMRTVLRVICRDSASEGRGLMTGVVRDADTDAPLVGALVVVMWTEMNIGTSSLSKLPKAAHTTVGERGNYRLCGLPNGVALRAQARLGTKASGWIDVTMPPGGVLQRDFLVGQRLVAAAPAPAVAPGAPPSAEPAHKPLGTAQLNGTVVGADGKPLEGAQVYLVGTAVGARADSRGVFRLTGLPAGTQTVEVRLLSYSPKRYTVDLSPARESRLSAVMDAKAQVLGEVTVQGKATSSIPGFDDRAKRGMGTFLNRAEIENRQSVLTTDLFRTIPGLTVGFDGTNYVVQSSRSLGSGCQVQWYLDGSPYDNSQNDLDQMLRPDDIEAVEVYKSASEVPVQFQGRDASCGTILVWTKRTAGRAKKNAAKANP